MKKFFMMNLFFAAICMYLVYSAVDSSFELVRYNFNLTLPAGEKTSEEIQKSQEILLQSIALIKELKKREEAKLIEKAKLFKAKKSLMKRPVVAYSKIDFTPKKITQKPQEKISYKKQKFLQVKKKISTRAMPITASVEFKKQDPNKRKIKEIKLELSYDEIPEQGKFEINKIQQVAWSDYAIDFNKYKELNRPMLAQVKNHDDRISTAVSAPERSSVPQNDNSDSMNFSGSSKKIEFQQKDTEVAALSKQKPKEELVFFDYEETAKKAEVETKIDKVVPIKVDSEIKEEVSIHKNNRSPAIDPLEMQKSIVSSLQQPAVPTAKDEKLIDEKKILAEAIANIRNKSKKNRVPKVAQVEDRVNKKDRGIDSAAKKGEENSLVEAKNYACLDPKDLTISDTYETEYAITLTGVDYSDRRYGKVRNFEARFHDDHNEAKKDYGNGKLNLSFKMNTQMSVRKATFVSRGYYPTTTDLVFEAGKLEANIPVFSLNSFDKVLEDNNLRGLGGHILIELDDKTEDVELDKATEYEAKLYLNKQFKVVSRSSYDYYFVLFVGVEVGNTEINFRNNKDKYISKLIHVNGDEIYYEPNFYAEIDSDNFSVYEERLLSKCKSIKNINPGKLEAWSYDGKFSKEALNKINVKNMIYPLGARKYIEFKHLEESIFVGRWSEENVIIPSEEYISHVLGKFNLGQSQSKCLVHLNFTKPIADIAFNGQSGNNAMNMQIQVLDADGQFYDSFSSQSERAFIMGEDTGVINIKIDYKDGSTQYLQSYCSDNTYIVEQL